MSKERRLFEDEVERPRQNDLIIFDEKPGMVTFIEGGVVTIKLFGEHDTITCNARELERGEPTDANIMRDNISDPDVLRDFHIWRAIGLKGDIATVTWRRKKIINEAH